MTEKVSVKQAELFHDMGQLERAAEVYRRVVEHNPCDSHALYCPGCLMEEMAETAEAEQYFLAAHRLIPNEFNAAYKLAGIYFLQGDLAAAEKYYRQCSELRPESGQAVYNLGLIEYKRKNWTAAIGYFEHVNRMLDNEAPDVTFMLGMSYRAEVRWHDALNMLSKAAEHDTRQPDIHFYLAEVCMQLNLFERAEQEYRQALSILPDNIMFMFGVAMACVKHGSNERAMEILRQLLSVAPDYEPALRLRDEIFPSSTPVAS